MEQRDLRELRTDLGHSQDRLAAQAGLRQATISDIERGECRASPASVRALAAALGVEVEVVGRACRESYRRAHAADHAQAGAA